VAAQAPGRRRHARRTARGEVVTVVEAKQEEVQATQEAEAVKTAAVEDGARARAEAERNAARLAKQQMAGVEAEARRMERERDRLRRQQSRAAEPEAYREYADRERRAAEQARLDAEAQARRERGTLVRRTPEAAGVATRAELELTRFPLDRTGRTS
jgi:colicin import membrane protein